jgi:hypothetical protein
MAALEFRLAETLGGTAKPGWSPRKGRPFEFLPRRKPCRNTADQPFLFQLRIRSFMPRWRFRCVLLRAKETLRLAKLDRSSHGGDRRWLIRGVECLRWKGLHGVTNSLRSNHLPGFPAMCFHLHAE